MNQTYAEVVKVAAYELASVSSTPVLDVELLLAWAMESDRTALHIKFDQPILSEELARFKIALERRKCFEPIAYIVGQKEFYGLNFMVNNKVLVPRPETELLVEKSLSYLKECQQSRIKVLDLGTGSGCIAITLAYYLKLWRRDFELTAVDVSAEALDIASDNALLHGVAADIEFCESSWFSTLNDEKFNLIVSNPPYVATSISNLPRDLSFEPKIALYAGKDGMDDIKILMQQSDKYLKDDGIFFCEVGEEQQGLIESFYAEINQRKANTYQKLDFFYDLAGRVRAFSLRKIKQ